MFPNSAPDSLTPNHCKAPDVEFNEPVDVATLDEEVGTEMVEVAAIVAVELVETITVEETSSLLSERAIRVLKRGEQLTSNCGDTTGSLIPALIKIILS